MDKATSDRLVGTTIAQYEITARIGGGGMGIVYAARDTKLGRKVALKFLPPQWSHDEGAKQRFMREAQAASATNHPYICTVHDIGEADDGQLFIVMAHHEGATLKQRLESGPLDEEAIEIAAQVAEGLAKAHAAGVVHRDIKPGNLILTEEGVRILDFGLAKFSDARLKLTLEGTTIGTVAYMSPEQIRGEEADARSDVWATGVVLYEMLGGRTPFAGAYPEAIAHAIKTDTPAPLRSAGPHVTEALEQLVFRALHKNPAVRFQTARELARALRLLQGSTLPLDLRTEPVLTATTPVAASPVRTVRRTLRLRLALAAVAALLLIGSPLWMLWPVSRVPIVVAPIVNQSGFDELDAYRMALTAELVASLGESRSVRVLPYDRLLEIVRQFRSGGQTGGDVSNREAMQALATYSGAALIVVPTLVYQDNRLRAQVSVRDARASTDQPIGVTDGVVSALSKEAAYDVVGQLARRIEAYFVEAGPWRARLTSMVRDSRVPGSAESRFASLDVALQFERGLDAYNQEEYVASLDAFVAASTQDPRNPLLLAWRSRVARMMRQDAEARDAADAALTLPMDSLPAGDRLLIQAITAETRRETAAETHYRALVDRFPDEALWQLELAAFLERQTQSATGTSRSGFRSAEGAYLQALALDDRLVRPHLELCRLYGPTRLNEVASARTEGEEALGRFAALGARDGEAQAGLCLSDALRAGTPDDLRAARKYVDMSVSHFSTLGLTYNLARAYNYTALVSRAEGNLPGAVADMERALDFARKAGNRGLEGALLINLGVMNVILGNRARALAFYDESYKLHEAFGDNQFAAYSQANGGALLVEFGADPDRGRLALQNALAVVRTIGDKNFEVFCLQVLAAYGLNHGQYDEAAMLMNQARSIALERNLADDVAALRVDLSRIDIARGRYDAARAALEMLIADGAGQVHALARLRLAQVNIRLAEFDAAALHVDAAAAEIEKVGDTGALPLLDLVRGELAYERNDARAIERFLSASARWTDDFPDVASVEARAYAGLFEARAGNVAGGRTMIVESLQHAERTGRVTLAAQCRVFLARLEMGAGRATEAREALNNFPAGETSILGAEIQAQIHYWRGQALSRSGDSATSLSELALGRQTIERFVATLPERSRAPFLARRDIRLVTG